MRILRVLALMCILSMALPSCKTQKHLEVDRTTNVNQEVSEDENIDRNTVKHITIIQYSSKKDTTTGEYPIEKVTDITETNNDKVVKKKAETTKVEEEETVKAEEKPSNNWKWYIICFCAGAATVIIIWFIVKLIIWYIRK